MGIISVSPYRFPLPTVLFIYLSIYFSHVLYYCTVGKKYN